MKNNDESKITSKSVFSAMFADTKSSKIILITFYIVVFGFIGINSLLKWHSNPEDYTNLILGIVFIIFIIGRGLLTYSEIKKT